MLNSSECLRLFLLLHPPLRWWLQRLRETHPQLKLLKVENAFKMTLWSISYLPSWPPWSVIYPRDPVADWQLGLPDTSWYHGSVIANITSPGKTKTQNLKHCFCWMSIVFAPSLSQKIVSQTTTSRGPSVRTFHINIIFWLHENIWLTWDSFSDHVIQTDMFHFIVLS